MEEKRLVTKMSFTYLTYLMALVGDGFLPHMFAERYNKWFYKEVFWIGNSHPMSFAEIEKVVNNFDLFCECNDEFPNLEEVKKSLSYFVWNNSHPTPNN